MKYNKHGQIWVETVLYTLIGLALIGVVLAIVTPKINDARDRISVEQTIDSLNVLDERINDVLDRGVGNIRIVPSFSIKRGELFVDSSSDEISFVISNLRKPYSEVGVPINIGRVEVVSEEGQKDSKVTLKIKYEGDTDLIYGGQAEELKKFTPSSTPYRFSIQNLGERNDRGVFVVDIQETSRRS